MIETEQTVAIAAPIAAVWNHARDISRWAELMPGMRECEVIDADRSRWVLKVGVGGLVRTVTVNVTVEQWDGPGEVRFSYALIGDPVQGGGTYHARDLGPAGTEVTFRVEVEGSGPLAPMWEAMGRPLLPQLARGFAEQFKAAIEAEQGAAKPAPSHGLLARLREWLRRLF